MSERARVNLGVAIALALAKQKPAGNEWHAPVTKHVETKSRRPSKMTEQDDAMALRYYLEGYSVPEIIRKMDGRFCEDTIRTHIGWYKVPGDWVLDMERVDALLRRYPADVSGWCA
jgi:hypothetical protein